jgi:putative transposase
MFPKALLVDIDGYAQELSRYIHLNPIKTGMVEKPEQYKWSSYRDYINVNKSSKWLCIDFVLSLFCIKTSIAKKQYRRFVESMIDVEYESPLKNGFDSTILGGRSFINQIKEKHLDRKKSDRDLPDLKQFYEMPDLGENN